MAPQAMPRVRRRSLRKKMSTKRIVLIVVAALLVIALGTYYVIQYRRHLIYTQYPLRYKDLIVRIAGEYDLEPWHIAAVIRCESSFDPKATSSVGARGLMQIMPDTGQWLAGKFREAADFDPEVLYDPETNIKYGCWYLNWLMTRYGRNIVLATCAYHAGHGTVDRWLHDQTVSPDGLTIPTDAIPYESTAKYVTRVLKAYDNYEKLYDFET